MRWSGRMVSVLVALLVGAVPGVAAQQQDDDARIRATLGGEFRVGRPAPALQLPYLTAQGRGPVDQPFDLARELGRVVVLAVAPTRAGEGAGWAALAAARDSLFGADVVLVGLSPSRTDSLLAGAARIPAGLKLLSDPEGSVARRYALDHATGVVLVVGRDGQVRYREERFPGALHPSSSLVAAVQAAKEFR